MSNLFRRRRRRLRTASIEWDRFGMRTDRIRVGGRKQQGGASPAVGVQLARRSLAILVHRPGFDAQFARDLFGIPVGVNQSKALALTFRQLL